MIDIIEANKRKFLPLGWQGESRVTAVRFDFGAWKRRFGEGVLSLRVRRPQDTEAHLAALEAESDTTALWTVTPFEVETAGEGEAQLFYTAAGGESTVKASAHWGTEVRESLTVGDPAPEQPLEHWYESLLAAAARSEAAAREAESALAALTEALENAGGQSGQSSPGGSGAVLSVNGRTGNVVLSANDVGALPEDTAIPEGLSELSDDAGHRTVTDAEKAAWNAKQSAIGDLSAIRAGAQAGETAVQPEALSAYATGAQLSQKLDRNLGAQHAGKFLAVGSDGAVTATVLSQYAGEVI